MNARTAKIFMSGRSQAVRLPIEFRFDGEEVFIRRDPATGDVILSRKPTSWDEVFALQREGLAAAGFLEAEERRTPDQERDPFAGWSE